MSETALDPGHYQRQAADSAASVWVAASAGTGKTKVLTDRVLNQLLSGTAPARILCLTFTKAAAAEMSNRLNNRLSGWAIAGDMELSDSIRDITGQRPDETKLETARQLFARVLDTPGGMRILTIHAFCQSVLRRFPLEAGIPPQFDVMDDRSAAELLADAEASVLNRARLERDGPLAAALAEVTGHVQEGRFAELLKAVTLERGRLALLIERSGGLDRYLMRLRRSLGLQPGEDAASCLAALCAEAAFDGAGLRRAADVLAASNSITDQRCGEGLATWLALDQTARAMQFETYRGQFLTKNLEPKKKLCTKGLAEREAWLPAVLEAEQARILAGQQRMAATVVNDATAALTRLAAAFLDAYETAKRSRALLDYDDLILATRDLLHRQGVAPWVLFKLDGGIDHILIDEAQDTNPDQWQVVTALCEEFFAGDAARAPTRTVFAVGDAKQSIFSFQRADPLKFVAMQEHFRRNVQAAQRNWRAVPLQISFRSTSAVLETVDAVFAGLEARDGVALDGAVIRHEAFRAGHGGRVELWPPIEPADEDEPAPWTPPVEQFTRQEPRARLALLVAQTIANWLASGERLVSKDRPIRTGDVMILVRRRTGFVTELARELKRLGVPVAGTDRMVLSRQLAVMDLMALGRFLLLPEDDLTLATVLKSPLLGIDEEQLFELAYRRPGTLWQALRDHPAPWAASAAEFLRALLARADYVPPYELYAEVLTAGGRKRLLSRLGHEAAEAIDEFVAQSLAYEAAHVPSLQGFLAWLDSGDVEVKRDLDQAGRDEVRIMTVHGSKGLQAPIVFLPDTLSVPNQTPLLMWPEAEPSMLWVPSAAGAEPVSSQAKAVALTRRDQEYRRLLYVALTRAEDRLYVCGWKTRRGTGRASWYDLIQAGMLRLTGGVLTPIPAPPDAEAFTGDGLVHSNPQTAPVAIRPMGDAGAKPSAPLPAHLMGDPRPEPSPPRPMIASRPRSEEPAVRSPLGTETDRHRFQRGLLIHRLMQTLPDLAADQMEPAARRYLARAAHALAPDLQNEIARETLAVLRHPEFAPLFGPGSKAEVPIVGLIDGRALSARVDRLVVTETEVLVVDYKTNRPPPRSAGLVASAYREQLAAYRTALALIYPGRLIRTLLLWTDGPTLMEIEPAP